MRPIICLDDKTDILNFGKGERELTFGKRYNVIRWYEIKEDGRQYVSIINDMGKSDDYLLSRFVSAREFRNFQIDKILTDEN